MKTARLIASMASVALLGGAASDKLANAAAPSGQGAMRVDNFMLVDQNLEAHELYRLTGASAVVLVTEQNGDAATQRLAPQINKLAADYGAKGVEFMMINSSTKDSWEEIKSEATKVGYKVPILMDDKQIIGESLRVTRSAEAMVIDPKTWTIVYKGAVAGLPAALEAMLAGEPAPPASAPGEGAPIVLQGREGLAPISYAKDIAPILEKKCVSCHEEGGIGPFAMSSYSMVKGFAPMIREVIRTDRMPPYHADPRVGHFSDDSRLTPDEIKTIVHWVDQGATRGAGTDPLAAVKHVAPEWPLGKPDLVLNIPAFTVPASGVVDYQRPYTVNPEKEGHWIRAGTVVPGDPRAVHHILTGWMKDVPGDGVAAETKWHGHVSDYAVGSGSEIYEGDIGLYLPAGGAIGYQMHYTPYGKETVDHSKIGVYFRKTPPKYIMRDVTILDPTIEIPAGEARHREMAYVYFPKDALLYSAFPHAHYRAYSSDLWIEYPDGKMKLLLALPRYDFNWQRTYTFADPVKIPAGSKLIAHYVYDNSKANPANPDSSVKVLWGEQSFQEMLYTSLAFRWMDETAAKQIDSAGRFGDHALFGMMDKDLDGKLQRAELRGRLGQAIAEHFDQIDTDHDGSIDVAEMKAAAAFMPRRFGGESQARTAKLRTPG